MLSLEERVSSHIHGSDTQADGWRITWNFNPSELVPKSLLQNCYSHTDVMHSCMCYLLIILMALISFWKVNHHMDVMCSLNQHNAK